MTDVVTIAKKCRAELTTEIARLDEHRKAQHDEGADALRERLADRVALDDHTARRLFTLVCSLSYRG